MQGQQNYKSDPNQVTDKDCYQTPMWALTPLLPYLPHPHQIWEPCAGEGYLAAALMKAGGSHLGWISELQKSWDIRSASFGNPVAKAVRYSQSSTEYHSNFFDFSELPARTTTIVTNPPYGTSVKYAFIEHCKKIAPKFALLLPLPTLGSQQMVDLIDGLDVMVITPRVAYRQQGEAKAKPGVAFNSMWLTKGLGCPKMIVVKAEPMSDADWLAKYSLRG